MFGLGTQELLLILLIVVVLFGAAKIPELARSLGKGVSEFRKAQKEGRDEKPKDFSAQPAGETAAAMTNCPACQKGIPAGTPFCPKCGKCLKAAKSCRACQNQAGPDEAFCPKCGEKL